MGSEEVVVIKVLERLEQVLEMRYMPFVVDKVKADVMTSLPGIVRDLVQQALDDRKGSLKCPCCGAQLEPRNRTITVEE